VVFVLLASVAFALDLTGSVIGTVDVSKGGGYSEADPNSGGTINRARIEGSGEVGAFGGWFRSELSGIDSLMGGSTIPANTDIFGFYGNVWWQPLDMLRIQIGGNGGDGYFGKDGTAGYMFYGAASDTGVVEAGNAWGKGYNMYPSIDGELDPISTQHLISYKRVLRRLGQGRSLSVHYPLRYAGGQHYCSGFWRYLRRDVGQVGQQQNNARRAKTFHRSI